MVEIKKSLKNIITFFIEFKYIHFKKKNIVLIRGAYAIDREH